MKNFFRKTIYKYLYEIRLQTKLIIAFFVMSLALLGISSLVIMEYVSSFVEKQLLNSATETFDQTTTSLQNTLFTYDQISAGIARSGLFNEVMSKDMEHYTIGQITMARQDFERNIFALLQSHVSNTAYEVEFKAYFNDGFDYFNNLTRYYSLEDYQNEPWCAPLLEQYQQNRSGFYIIPEALLMQSSSERGGYFSMIRVAMDLNHYFHILALVRMDISIDYLNDLITMNAFDHTLSAVVNKETLTLASSDHTDLLSTLYKQYDLWSLPNDTWYKIRLNHENYVIRTVQLPDYELLHFSLIPEKSLYSSIGNIRTFLLVTMLFMFLLCVPLSNIISHALVFRLQNVVNTMLHVKEGTLSTFQGDMPQGTDEIGNLISSYNYMVEQMQLLMEQEYAHGAEIKNAELKALQAQINPHFLYNTLDMIHWFAKEEMLTEIEQSVSALAQFYRIGLSNGREVITLREELKQAEAYMHIWNLRLQDAITYQCRVDPKLLDCLIIKSTLQPLLENSIAHGIREKEIPTGTIQVDISQNENEIFITVQDNGIGISPETLKKLNEDSLFTETSGHGYGLHNVQSRLKLYYGTSYGLTYSSIYGKGTTINIRIPKETIY